MTSLASDTTLSRVIYLVEEAQSQRAPFQTAVDRFTRYYTPAVVGLAAAVAVLPPALGALSGVNVGGFSEWFYRALVLLVVSCPCALVISTPVAIVSAITRATRDGVLVKGGSFLEIAPRVRAIAFDKTGTLTEGRPEVADVRAFHGWDAESVLETAATLEAESTHPLARAVVRAVADVELPSAQGVVEHPGRGVSGMVRGVTWNVTSPGRAQESVAFDEDADAAIAALETDGRSVLVPVSYTHLTLPTTPYV